MIIAATRATKYHNGGSDDALVAVSQCAPEYPSSHTHTTCLFGIVKERP